MFFSYIMTIASFDLIPTADFWDTYFPNTTPTGPINSNFATMGYTSMYLIYNIGSVILSFLAFLLLALISCFLKLLRKFKCCNWLYNQITKRLFWNSTITSISESYLVLVMCVCINTLNVSANLYKYYSLLSPLLGK